MKQFRFEVSPAEAGSRLDLFLASQPEADLSRAQIQRLISEGLVTVSGQNPKASYKVEAGDEVNLTVLGVAPSPLMAEPLPLEIVYEDADLLVINKGRGMVVHPAAGHAQGTLVNALLAHITDPAFAQVGGPGRPGIVHRLDRDTTGLLVVAKSPLAYRSLTKQIKERQVERHYLALVHGVPATELGLIDAPIGRHPRDRKRMAVLPKGGREAVTRFHLVERLGAYSLLACQLETGRTHQIRVHLAYIDHPVVGDAVYGPRRQHLGLTGQGLHATRLAFTHPRSGEGLTFEAEPPTDLADAIELARALA